MVVFVDHLNFVLTQLEENGILEYFDIFRELKDMKDGRNFARYNVTPSSEYYSVYKGSAFITSSNDGKLVNFLFKLLYIPLSISSLVFIMEIVKHRIYLRTHSTQVFVPLQTEFHFLF